MRGTGKGYRPERPVYREALHPRGGALRVLGYVPYVFGGMMLVAAFAFAGHYMGQNAVARSLPADQGLGDIVSPATTIVAKVSLFPSDTSLDLVDLPLTSEQEVMSSSKADYVDPDPGAASATDMIVIEPASADPRSTEPVKPKIARPDPALLKLAMTPPVWKLESTFKMKRSEKQKIIAQRRARLAEENCLAKAVYFEARSETELGQLAVAKVVMNRVKDPEYPKSICGVVYQGSDRRNSCQFSFACDGLPDDVRNTADWARSKKIAQKALAGDQTVRVMGAATHYHADYVKPRWSYQMRKLIKIGRHIFYTDS